jgi:long-chain acyl-CoA synthetase
MIEYTIADVVRVRAAQDPTRLAMRSEARSVTWVELYQSAKRLAGALQKVHIGPQDRVSLIERNGIEHFEFVFGCALLNAIPVPINWRLSPAEILETLTDAGSRVLIVGSDFREAIETIEKDLDPAVLILFIGTHPRWPTFRDWCAGAEAVDPMIRPSPGDVALHFYSSGTTGRPKGILWSAANAEFLLRDTSRHYGIKRDDISLLTMPLFHSGGTGWALCGMINGCKSVTIRQFEATAVLATIARERISVAMFVPAMLASLCASAKVHEDVQSMRQINYTGSPISEQNLLQAMQVFKCDFIQNYGLAETTGGFAQLDAVDHDPGGPRSCLLRSVGKPYPGVEVKIVNTATGADCAPRQVGELWTRSGQNMPEYWHRPEETARTLTPEGWLKTGDGGYMDEEGYIFLTVRLKDVIISGGENIYPTEVENVLASHDAVAEVAVIGVPSERWGETVKAVVVLKPGRRSCASDLIEYCGSRLAAYKRPTSVDFVDALPRNPTGKLLKAVLREAYWHDQKRNIA